MRRRRLDSLAPSRSLPASLYSEGAYLLHSAGSPLTADHVRLLGEHGFFWVVEVENPDEVRQLEVEAQQRSIAVEELEADKPLARAIYDYAGNLILDAGHVVSRELKDKLLSRGIKVIRVRRNQAERGQVAVDTYRKSIVNFADVEEILPDDRLSFDQCAAGAGYSGEISPESFDAWFTPENTRIRPSGTPLSEQFLQRPMDLARTDPEKELFLSVYYDVARETERLFSTLQEGKVTNGEPVAEVTRRVVRALVKDRDLLLNLTLLRNGKGYILTHSVRVTMLTAGIATAMGYSAEQVFEIASSAFLNDVGMLRVPQTITDKPGKLSEEERLEVHRHPIHGINILQNVMSVPASAPFVAYQSHERLDGSGYPRGRQASLIHDFARIVAVADVYDALISPRPYRDAYLPYRAMEEIILMASKRRLDSDVVRAFLTFLSLFPVGSWVELNDGRKGKVVSTNGAEYTRPIVNILYDAEGRAAGPVRLDLRNQPNLKIVRALDPARFGDSILLGF